MFLVRRVLSGQFVRKYGMMREGIDAESYSHSKILKSLLGLFCCQHKPMTMHENENCVWFILPLLLGIRQSSFHEIVSDGIGRGIGTSGERSHSATHAYVELTTHTTTPSPVKTRRKLLLECCDLVSLR